MYVHVRMYDKKIQRATIFTSHILRVLYVCSTLCVCCTLYVCSTLYVYCTLYVCRTLTHKTHFFDILLVQPPEPGVEPEVFPASEQRVERIELRAVAQTAANLSQLVQEAVTV